ncbi:hypothetical protein JCM9279_006428 [Rhodotorula babjevae]
MSAATSAAPAPGVAQQPPRSAVIPPPRATSPPSSRDPDAHRDRSRSSTRTDPADECRRRVEDYCGHVRLSREGQLPAFELLVLGCGGGPIETNLSSFLVKPYASKWTEGCTGIEGGSTIGAVASLVERNPYAFEGFGLDIGVDAHELKRELELSEAGETPASGETVARGAGVVVGREGGGKAAARVWDLVRCFAITHAHLDHIAGLIISSAACRPPPRPVYGIKRTIANIERLMDGGVWPMLGGWDDSVTIGRAYHYKNIPTEPSAQLPLSSSLSFHAYPLSHGTDPSAFHKHRKTKELPRPQAVGPAPAAGGAAGECYDSTAFFVREEHSGRELLFFGDVEPDSISRRGFNLDIWKAAAPKIVAGKLSVIFLECSYPSSQPKDKLFGHFSPPFILEEMVVFADLVRRARVDAGWSDSDAQKTPLRDVIVVIQHIKDDIFTFPTPSTDSPPPVPPKDPVTSRSSSSTPRRSQPPSRSSTLDAPRAPPCSSFSTSTTSPAIRDDLSPQSAPPLSMSPPVPAAPTRRPSSATFFSTSAPQLGFGFNSRSSPSSRVFSGDFAGFSLTAASVGAGAGGRRVSTPGHFFNGGGGLGAGSGNPWRNSSPMRLSPLAPPTGLAVDMGRGPHSPGAPVSPHSQPRTPGSAASPSRPAKEDEAHVVQKLGTYAIAEEPSSGQGSPRELGDDEVEPAAGAEDEVHEEEEELEDEEDEMVDETVHERIERELNELEAEARTGVRFLIALQGMRLVF